jgi:phage terminase small subunit
MPDHLKEEADMTKQKPQPITFAGWIEEQGVNALARKLGVDPSAVSKWKKWTAQPNLDHATAILAMAKGRLKPADLKKGGSR